MPKAEWGKKVICSNCGAKFYDLNRKSMVCPSCGKEYVEPSLQEVTSSAKQVFTDNVDSTADVNLVGSDASESIAEVEDLVIDDAIDDETISLEETESDDVSVIPDEEDDLDIAESPNENMEE